MDTYDGLLGFALNRNKYERKKKFQQRCVEEEREYIKSLVESQINVPKEYNYMIWSLKGLTHVPIMNYKIDFKDVEKRGIKAIYKNVKVRFELE